jgi:hypothetical protein
MEWEKRRLKEMKEKAKLTRTFHHIQPICHSIHERNPTKAQLEQEETILSQIWILTLQIKKSKLSASVKLQKVFHRERHRKIRSRKSISHGMSSVSTY